MGETVRLNPLFFKTLVKSLPNAMVDAYILVVAWIVLASYAVMPSTVAAQQGANDAVSQTKELKAENKTALISNALVPKVSISARTLEVAPTWHSLSAAEKNALKPMQADWASLDANRKKKWLAVAKRYQTMDSADQARMQQRMGQWAKLTPEQRSIARDNYSAVLSSPNTTGGAANDAAAKANLNDQWVKYQALSPEKKASLAEQSNKAATNKSKPLSGS